MNSSGSAVFRWDKDYLVQLLSSGKAPIITDPVLIEAFHKIDRKDFIPQLQQKDAYSDIELDIGFGERLNRPTIIAQMIAVLGPRNGGRYLDLGTGTGYSAAIIAFTAGQTGKVFTLERVQWIWELARNNMRKYPGIKNIEFIYQDGMEGYVGKAPYDGIHVAFAIENIPEKLKMQLNTNGGKLVCPTHDNNLKVVVRKGITEFSEEIIPGFRMDRAKVGMV
jgi:protein-L-isoaspartate(D-aspartate) O-methyltransferase